MILCAGINIAQASNQLAGHPSPYLAIHADDPVDWRPWQAAVFAEAIAENRMVLVSIGYFSCHWCHVMQRESYQDTGIASIINNRYIAVKVDRELEPDLDQRLISFVENTRGAAGWPLNVLLTPQGYPLTGFTYLPRNDFARVLEDLDSQWQQNHVSLSKAARDYFQSAQQDQKNQDYDAADIPAGKLIDAFVSQTMLAADELQGGIGDTSKFPNVPQFDALLDIIGQQANIDPDIPEFVNLTLQSMASKNLQDHVNGGFFRYTTDPDWQTPHFEKMLYDNAQLARLYLKAQQLWPDQQYAGVAVRTLDFIEQHLKHPQGGYMSSLSAVDRNDREGAAYLWTREQLTALLDAAELDYLLNLSPPLPADREFLIAPLVGYGASGDPARNSALLRKLQSGVSTSMPADDKRLASWNAMMLNALIVAAEIDPRFTDRANRLFHSMRDNFYRAGSLIRLAGNATAAAAVLEDYAQVADAFFNYGRKFGQQEPILFARRLTQRAYNLFLKDGRWQEKADTLIPITRGKWVIPDMVIPSPMTLWLKVALEVPGLDPVVRKTANTMLQRATREMLDAPYFYGSFITLRAQHAP